jgi:hypothetical protein
LRVSREAAEVQAAAWRDAAAASPSDSRLSPMLALAASMLADLIADRDEALASGRRDLESVAELIEAESAVWPEDVERLRSLARRVRDRAARLPER